MLNLMKATEVQTTRLANGFTLLVERLPDVQSVAFCLMIPAGSVYEPEGCNGTAAALCDWLTRGAGHRSNRELSGAIDSLGLQAHESVSPGHITLHGACLAEKLQDALTLLSDIVRRPHLADEQFEATMFGVYQSLQALEDEPRQKAMVELTRKAYPSPWNRPPEGTLEDLDHITPDVARAHYEQCFAPEGVILGIAGNVQVEQVNSLAARLFGDWQANSQRPAIITRPSTPTIGHLSQESTQTQITLAYPTVAYPDPDYYAAWAAVSVLGGGMSSRLFTAVREKEGLCYSVYATLHSLRDAGFVVCYAGTTNDRAQETLDALMQEVRRLEAGIEESELKCCQARAKSALIMSQESTSARAAGLARDWYYLGRTVSLAEVRTKIEALTVETVADYFRRHPAQEFTLITLGPNPLQFNNDRAISSNA